MSNVAFVILSHDSPERLLRLTKTLQRMYDRPHILCHHNFTLCDLEKDAFRGVEFVEPHIDARWGALSLVLAGLAGMAQLSRHQDWEWFFLLSGSDYPIANSDSVRSALAAANYDALIDTRAARLIPDIKEGPDHRGEFSPARPYSQVIAYDRYVSCRLFVRPVGRNLRVRSPTLLRLVGKWPDSFSVYHGDQWFGGNRKTVAAILNHPERDNILTHLRYKKFPEEAAYQTLVGNSELRVAPDNRRFSKWPARVSDHPHWLGVEDLDAIMSSGAWFARKFLPNGAVLDALDFYLARGVTSSPAMTGPK